MSISFYLLFSLSIYLFMYAYVKVAKSINFYDIPNDRSSHVIDTVTGIGIAFPISVFVWYLLNFKYHFFFLGLLILTICSIIDDVIDLKVYVRIFIQSISVSCLLQYFYHIDLSVIIIFLIIILNMGWLNAFNFMDGINGIMASYSLINLFTFFYINFKYQFIEQEILIFLLIPLTLFMIFNFRNAAISFSGNSGTMAMAYILSLIMIKLIDHANDWKFIIFFSVYGLDTVFTIIERLILKENIFKPHRRHLYQLMVDKHYYNHLNVSIMFSLYQIIINIVFINLYDDENSGLNILLFITLLVFSVAVYFATKYFIKKK